MAEWKKVEEFPNYSISDEGHIRNDVTDHVRKNKTDRYGYSFVNLKKGGKTYSRSIHGLVAKAYLSKPEGKDEINHIDGNKSNNSVENLEYVTRSENIKHAFATGLNKHNGYIPSMKGHKNPHQGYNKKPIRCVDTNEEFGSISECANEMDLNPKHVGDVIHGRRKTHKGFKFEPI